MNFSVEVIVSSYRNPTALEACLEALSLQTLGAFGICVAEDAQDIATAEVVAKYPCRHLHQPDDGFRKNRILNEAIRTSDAEYLIFVDGDCIAHPGFVARHVACARRERYLSGGVVRLSQRATDAVTLQSVSSADIWTPDWLRKHGVWDRLGTRIKLMPDTLGPIMDRVSLARKRWLGGNASTFRDNLFTVNGYDASLEYGAEDKELGVRLENAGIKPYSIRYTAPILHLEHDRGYVTRRKNHSNLALIEEHRRTGETRPRLGLM